MNDGLDLGVALDEIDIEGLEESNILAENGSSFADEILDHGPTAGSGCVDGDDKIPDLGTSLYSERLNQGRLR